MDSSDKNKRAFLRPYIREHKAVFVVYVVLRLIVLACMVLAAAEKEWESVFVCILVLLLFLVPDFLARKLDLRFPSALQIIILLFIFAAEILGELGNYYIQYPNWDTLLHITWGFLCAAIGFSLVDILNRDSRVKLQLSPLYLALAAFCFSMTIGVFWEFFEFFADRVLGLDMQKDTVIHAFRSVMLDPTMSNIPVEVAGIADVAVNGESLGLGGYLDIGLYDTMEDLFINFVGAALFSLVGFIDARRDGRSRLTAALVPKIREE